MNGDRTGLQDGQNGAVYSNVQFSDSYLGRDYSFATQPIVPATATTQNASLLPQEVDFSNIDLECTINADDIRNRWLNTFVPIPGQAVKHYPVLVTAFIDGILKSYVAVVVRGKQQPPFVHPLQLSTASPLTTCLSLSRMCQNPATGSEAVVTDLLKREMASVYESRYANCSLATFQAYLIYSMTLFYRFDHAADPFLRQAVMNLQDLACLAAQDGLTCKAATRPKWEAWIVAEAKRRTLYIMYLFDNVLSSLENMPSYVGTELAGLPASSDKMLWRADTRPGWDRAYNCHLAEWADGSLTIEELWARPPHLDDEGYRVRRARVERWLEAVDEYGTMMYAVTSCTHGT